MLIFDDAAQNDKGYSPVYSSVSVPGMLRYKHRNVEQYFRASLFHQMWQLSKTHLSGVCAPCCQDLLRGVYQDDQIKYA